LNRIAWRYASPTHVFDLAVSTSIAMLLFALTWVLFPELELPVNLLINFGIFSFVGFIIVRYRERLITGLASRWIRWRSQSTVMGERVLVVGAGDASQLAIWLLEKSNLFSAFSIIGMVDDDFRKVKQRINGYTVLGTTRDIPEIVTSRGVGLIMFAIANLDKKDRDRILALCNDLPARVLLIPDLLKVVSNYFTRQTREVGQNE
jgi:FlaA1/EpsC-like NDP-sugar epimerase